MKMNENVFALLWPLGLLGTTGLMQINLITWLTFQGATCRSPMTSGIFFNSSPQPWKELILGGD